MTLNPKLDPSCVLCFPFEESGGNIAYDQSNYGNNGTIYGATRTLGKIRNGLYFDGVDDWIQVPNSPSLQPSKQITIEMWASIPPGIKTMPYLLHKFDNVSPYPGYAIMLNEDGATGHAGVWVGGGFYVNGITDIRDGKFHHIAGGTDGSKTFLYLDGKLEKAVSQTPNLVSTKYLSIGPGDVLGQWFKGLIDEVRIYNRALSAKEIYTHYIYGLRKKIQPRFPEFRRELRRQIFPTIRV